MQEATYLILTALADSRRHGYAVILEVDRISGGRVRLRPGTLYGALDRLVAEGLVVPDGDEVVDGRRRQYYVLTNEGADALAQETQSLQSRVKEAKRRLLLRSTAVLA